MSDNEYGDVRAYHMMCAVQELLPKAIIRDNDPVRKDYVKAILLVEKIVDRLGRRLKIEDDGGG